jgi:hypothetical protein
LRVISNPASNPPPWLVKNRGGSTTFRAATFFHWGTPPPVRGFSFFGVASQLSTNIRGRIWRIREIDPFFAIFGPTPAKKGSIFRILLISRFEKWTSTVPREWTMIPYLMRVRRCTFCRVLHLAPCFGGLQKVSLFRARKTKGCRRCPIETPSNSPCWPWFGDFRPAEGHSEC